VELTKGYELLIRDGQLDIFGFVFAEVNGGFNMPLFQQSNMTGITVGGAGPGRPELYGPPGSFKWAQVSDPQVSPNAVPYYPSLKSWSHLDEQDLTNPANVQATANWFAARRADPRFKNVILHTNQYGLQFEEPVIADFMRIAKPDALSFDYYIWGTAWNHLHSNGSPAALYRSLAKYQRLALKGNDGTGRAPIPFGKWLQTFITTSDLGPAAQAFGYRMSESELRLDQFAGWAFGAKWATAFTYDSAEKLDSRVAPLLLRNAGGPDAQPAAEFFEFAETNRQSRNLGRALIGLLSYDVRMVKGPRSYQDNGVPDFDATADPFLKTITAQNLGSTNNGERGDVVVGFFQPVLEKFIGANPVDHTYFMIVNGLTWKDTSAADTAQRILVDFNFAGTNVTSLLRLSRLTGQVETVPLTHLGGTIYRLDLLLEGGTGDLFKYRDGTSTFFVPEPAGVALALIGVAGLTARPRRRSSATAV
jgi:hypothetical protein